MEVEEIGMEVVVEVEVEVEEGTAARTMLPWVADVVGNYAFDKAMAFSDPSQSTNRFAPWFCLSTLVSLPVSSLGGTVIFLLIGISSCVRVRFFEAFKNLKTF